MSTPITAARLNNIEAGVVAAYVPGAGGLTNADIAAAAAIVLSKLAGYPSDPTKFARGDGTWAVPPVPASSPTPATTLPASPTDGQQAILVDSLAAPTYSWLLQWSAGAGKWLFIGGSPLFAENDTLDTVPGVTYTALATAGPQVTIPRAGSYIVTTGFKGMGVDGNFVLMSYTINGVAASDADLVALQNNHSSTATAMYSYTSVSRSRVKTALSAGPLVAQYRSAGGASAWTVGDRFISVLPVAL